MGRGLVVPLVVAFFVCGVVAIDRPFFRDVSRKVGFKDTERKKYWSATVADIDRNGYVDFVLSNHNQGETVIYFGKEDGTFTFDAENPLFNADWHGTAAGDLTGNGLLDIVVTKGGGRGSSLGLPVILETRRDEEDKNKIVYNKTNGEDLNIGERQRGRTARIADFNHDGLVDIVFINAKKLDGSPNIHIAYKNLGNGNFRRVTTGIEKVNAMWATMLDVDGDGYLDLLFEGRTFELWLGRPGFRFRKDTTWLPDLNYNNVNSAVEFDFNNDGRMDIYVCRGRRNGNTDKLYNDYLLMNTGRRLVDVSREANIPEGGVCQHATDADLNNDGAVDLYISQGGKSPGANVDWILMNDGNGEIPKFEFIANSAAASSRSLEKRGNISHTVDYNMDGRADLIVGDQKGRWRLLENVTPRSNNEYMIVRVGRSWRRGAYKHGVQAIGALVKITCFGRRLRYIQRVGSRGESHSQSYMDTLHFGLGTECTNKNGRVFSVKVAYIGGLVFGRKRVKANQMLTVGKYNWEKM